MSYGNMDVDLLSLKWNNHRTTFLHVIKNLRSKASYTDTTLACDGKFYKVHRLVLSTCSDYFSDIFEQTSCKNPVIVLKDVECRNLEYLLDYMYIGEVNVKQHELASLVGAAECLRIKGLAVPDEDPIPRSGSSSKRQTSDYLRSSSPPMKKKRISNKISESLLSESDKEKHAPPVSLSSNRFICENSNEETSFIPIKSEPHSDEEIVDDNFIHCSNNQKENEAINDIDAETSQPSDSDMQSKNIVSKIEPLDPSDEDLNLEEPADIGPYNELYKPGLPCTVSESLDSDASYSHSQNDSMQYFPSGGITQSNLSISRHALPMQHSSPKPYEIAFRVIKAGLPISSDIGTEAMEREIGGVVFKIIYENNLCFFQCSLCTLQIFEQAKLRQHADTHTGGRPFKCNFCLYRSSNKSTMIYHIRMHKGEKPFACKYCNYRTASKQRVKSHMLSKHKDKCPLKS